MYTFAPPTQQLNMKNFVTNYDASEFQIKIFFVFMYGEGFLQGS